jgi:arginyl-tRNA synthetase
MVINCLSGVQQTLDTYNVRHDTFDFESELGWEGSNDEVLQRLKASPYFVPSTEKNEKGVPEGGHILLADYIRDAKLPTGKRVRILDSQLF